MAASILLFGAIMLVLFLGLLALLPSPVRADAELDQFQAAGAEIPAALMQIGYRDFGALSLPSLVDEIRQTPVSWATGREIGTRNKSGRISGRWEKKGNRTGILVDRNTWRRFPEDQPIFALHEYLGISGFDDHNYWLSTTLWFLSLKEARQALDEKALAGRISHYARVRVAGGTVVGVGGGGNILTLHLRAKRLRQSLANGQLDSIGDDLQSKLDTNVYYPGTQPKASRPKRPALPPYCQADTVSCAKFKVLPGNTCSCAEDPSQSGDILYPY